MRISLADRARVAWKAFREGAGFGGGMVDSDEELFRRLSSSKRDLSPFDQDKARQISYYLWERNPMAKRLIEMIVDFVVGDGLTITCVDEKVQAVVDEFWTDRVMQLDLRHRDFVRDLSLAGELALSTFTSEVGGRTRLGYIDQDRIRKIDKDPENALVDRTLWIKRTGVDDTPLAIVNLDETDPSNPHLAGEVFFHAINRPTVGTRGRPDLLALGDWLDGYDQLLWNIIERSGLLNAFVWDVTLEGAEQSEVDAWMQQYGTAPRPGSVRAHNEKETWASVSPDLGAAELEKVGRMIKNHNLGGAGLPEGWFADGDSANRATLQSQGDPTYRMLQSRQRLVKSFFEAILAYVVEQAVEAGRIPTSADTTVTVNIPEPSARDVAGLSSALVGLVNALTAAIADKLVSRKTSRSIFAQVAALLGTDIDVEDEEEQIEAEQAEAEAEQEELLRSSPDALAALDGMLGGGQPPLRQEPTTESAPRKRRITFERDKDDRTTAVELVEAQ